MMQLQRQSRGHIHTPKASSSSSTAAAQAGGGKRRAMQFRPCIDLHKGKVKQIVGSTLTDGGAGAPKKLETNFVATESPSYYADLYAEDDLYGGHVILLSKDQATQDVAREALRRRPNLLQVGGGVTPQNALSYLEEGASHVIVTSYVFKNGELQMDRLKELARVVGRERLVLDLSCRVRPGENDDANGGKYYVVTDRWQKFTSLEVDEASLCGLAEYCDEFLIHGVDVEGKQLGIDEALVRLLGRASPLPATYAGGVCSLEDLDLIKGLGQGVVDATVGSALDIFGGALPYKAVVQWHKDQQQRA